MGFFDANETIGITTFTKDIRSAPRNDLGGNLTPCGVRAPFGRSIHVHKGSQHGGLKLFIQFDGGVLLNHGGCQF